MTTEKEQLEAEIAERDARIAGLLADVDEWQELAARRADIVFAQNRELAALKAQQPSAGVVLPERMELDGNGGWRDLRAETHNRCLDEVARLNPCRAQAVPEGYVLVPVEPTLEMMKASKRELEKSPVIWCRYKAAYRALLAAAPSANSEQARACVTCNGVGIIGHSTLCPECAAAPSAQRKESGDE